MKLVARSQVMSWLKAGEASEWGFVVKMIVLVLVITSLPYLYAYLSTPSDKQFMGIVLDVPDHTQYLSWMRELSHSPLSANKLTPEPNEPLFFNLLWWGLGRLSKVLGLEYASMFQLLRLLAGTLFLLLAYWVCAYFFPDRERRRVAFVLITFTSGFGWVLSVLKYVLLKGQLLFPLDVFIVEGNTFLCILGDPHFIAAALYIFVFDLLLRGQARGQLRYAVAAGLVALFLGWQHAYDLVLVYGILGGYFVLMTIRDRQLPTYLIKSGLILGLISWWPALYSVVLTKVDPLWSKVLAQFANAGVYTPNLLHLPILLGPVFLLAIFSAIKSNPFRLRGLSNKDLFLRAWFWFNFLLIYVPTDYQIHMLNGWQVPMAILATQGLFGYIVPFAERVADRQRWVWPKERIRRGALVALILIILPTNVYLLLWRFADLARHDYPYYLYKDEVAALAWLEDNAEPDDVTLSSLTVGQYVPALTGMHAFLAHWAQTIDFYDKSAMVEEFFNDNTKEVLRHEILHRFSVDYVFYGPVERDLGTYVPENSPSLQRVYTSSRVTIYQVQK